MRRPQKSTLPTVRQRVFLVDGHPVTRDGLAWLISFEPDMEVCGQAGSAVQALVAIERANPDVVVVDISLNRGVSGIELIKDLVARRKNLRMLVLSTHDECLYAERILRAGGRGYVMKQEPTEKVMSAIRQVLQGGIYLSDAMKDRLLHKMIRPGKAPVPDLERFSDRELEVYWLIGRGLCTRQIAQDLHVSMSTIETYRSHIKSKLNLTAASDLVRNAVEWVHAQDS